VFGILKKLDEKVAQCVGAVSPKWWRVQIIHTPKPSYYRGVSGIELWECLNTGKRKYVVRKASYKNGYGEREISDPTQCHHTVQEAKEWVAAKPGDRVSNLMLSRAEYQIMHQRTACSPCDYRDDEPGYTSASLRYKFEGWQYFLHRVHCRDTWQDQDNNFYDGWYHYYKSGKLAYPNIEVLKQALEEAREQDIQSNKKEVAREIEEAGTGSQFRKEYDVRTQNTYLTNWSNPADVRSSDPNTTPEEPELKFEPVEKEKSTKGFTEADREYYKTVSECLREMSGSVSALPARRRRHKTCAATRRTTSRLSSDSPGLTTLSLGSFDGGLGIGGGAGGD
jgi:hypothetical protein